MGAFYQVSIHLFPDEICLAELRICRFEKKKTLFGKNSFFGKQNRTWMHSVNLCDLKSWKFFLNNSLIRQKLPIRLFKLLPEENTWMKFDATTVEERTFALTVCNTGSALNSVMIFIFIQGNLHMLNTNVSYEVFYLLTWPLAIFSQNFSNQFSVNFSHFFIFFLSDDISFIYTGAFKECRNVLLSDTIARYKHLISDIYLDNTLASSMHFDIGQSGRACKAILQVMQWVCRAYFFFHSKRIFKWYF